MKFCCDLLVTDVSILPVVQISELKWSERCQHIPQPFGLFITLFRLMGWGVFSEIVARMFTFPQYCTKIECTERQHTHCCSDESNRHQPSKTQALPVFRFIENPHHHLHSSPLKNSYPNHSICPARKKKFTRICDLMFFGFF